MTKENNDLLSGITDLSQGARAGRSGEVGKGAVEAFFRAYGTRVVNDNPEYHMHYVDGSDFFPRKERLLIRQHQVPTGQRLDFLYKDFGSGLILPIKCTNQMGSGTTDQKLAFTIEELLKISLHNRFGAFWLVLTGNGFSPKVMMAMHAKVVDLNKGQSKVHGRIIFHAGTFLQRAIERLVEKNDPSG